MCLGALIILNIEHILVFFKFYVGPRETINNQQKINLSNTRATLRVNDEKAVST